MSKSKSRNIKNASINIKKNASKGTTTESRAYFKKHSNIIGYLYRSEISEIDTMVRTAEKIANKKH